MRAVFGADQIVAVDGGRVVPTGTPAELTKQGGTYRHML